MRVVTLLTCTCVILLSACDVPSEGYYDANGHYVSNSIYNKQSRIYGPITAEDRSDSRGDYRRPILSAAAYDDRSYHMDEDGLNTPHELFPPRGMCRMWFKNRPIANQPRPESCDNIKSRTPIGAYVVYSN